MRVYFPPRPIPHFAFPNINQYNTIHNPQTISRQLPFAYLHTILIYSARDIPLLLFPHKTTNKNNNESLARNRRKLSYIILLLFPFPLYQSSYPIQIYYRFLSLGFEEPLSITSIPLSFASVCISSNFSLAVNFAAPTNAPSTSPLPNEGVVQYYCAFSLLIPNFIRFTRSKCFRIYELSVFGDTN